MKTRKAYINKFKSYLGTNAKTIIDIYNTIRPLPNGYKFRYTSFDSSYLGYKEKL